MGLVTIFWDGNFPNVKTLFDAEGGIADPAAYARMMDRFLAELIWMAAVLRYARENVHLT